VGLSGGSIPHDSGIANSSICHASSNRDDFCYLSGKHKFEWPKGAAKPTWKKGPGDVVGCGILVNRRENKLAIFFTGNGNLMGKGY
jgi:hypothetical protein